MTAKDLCWKRFGVSKSFSPAVGLLLLTESL